MIKLSKYSVGIKLKGKVDIVFTENVFEKAKETYFVLLIPESVVEDLKKGDIGEWE